jgi:hypothetical protein
VAQGRAAAAFHNNHKSEMSMNNSPYPPAPAPALATANTGSTKPTTVRWRIFLILLLLAAINYIDRASLSVALPLISAEFELTPALEGLILSAFFWSYALMQIPAGVLLDRFQVRNIIGVATSAGVPSRPWAGLLTTGSPCWSRALAWAWQSRRSCPPAQSSMVPG